MKTRRINHSDNHFDIEELRTDEEGNSVWAVVVCSFSKENKMELKNSLLMLIATIGTFALLYLLMFFSVPQDNAQILLAIVGPTLGFFFGSSVNKNGPTLPKGTTNEKVNSVSDSPAVPGA